jgi:hypothetical protein
VGADAQPDLMAFFLLDIAQPCFQYVPGMEGIQGPVVVKAACVGQGQGPPAFFEDLYAQLLFQVLYAEGQGGLGNEEPGGGPGDGPFLGGGDDILQLVPVHGDSFRKYYIQWQTGEETGKTENIVLNYENMTKLYIIQMQDTMIRYRKI